MQKKLILPNHISIKDDDGAYVKVPKPSTDPIDVVLPKENPAAMDGDAAVSIDDLKRRGLNTINLIMKGVWQDAVSPAGVSRENVQNLKDCMLILKDLKAEEQELLENLSDEELETLIKE